MSQLVALPSPAARTMLPRVSSVWPSSRGSLRHWARLSLACAAAFVAVITRLPLALAQGEGATDSGWFDAPESEVTPSLGAAPPVGAPVGASVPDTDASALTTFRPALEPYGRWVTDSQYGTVWVPDASAVGPNFQPYVSRGHWSLTADDDWMWVSDYPFGWAVFHYGRWVWVSGSGWAWVPGRTYANAWVVWRVPTGSYAYVGWAPMPPSWVWMNGAAVTLWFAPPLPYVFCSSSYLFAPHVHHHIVRDRYLVQRIAAHTRVYPSPYRAPARPLSRPFAASARERPAPMQVPRAPRTSTARIPSASLPAERAAAPASERRKVVSRRTVPDAQALPPSRRPAQTSTAPGVPARRMAPVPLRTPPRATAPARVRPAPSAVRELSPTPPRSRRLRRP